MRRFSLVAPALLLLPILAGAQTPPSTELPLPSPTIATPAQAYGRVTGRIIDAATGIGISDVAIEVVSTSLVTMSGIDGRFTLGKVPTGPIALRARRIGYGEKIVTGVSVRENETTAQDIALGSVAFVLSSQVVTAAAEAGTVNEALDKQRTAVAIVNSTTAEQISRSPDGNAAQAIQRVSGINLGENSSVTARGLSDKYTISSLNGSRIPSPEPETRIVPLDMFPSGLIQSITTAKTFTPDLQGDFAGALVDIKTREFPARRMWTVQFMPGYASGATGSRLIAGQSAGGEALGMAASKRALPPLFRYVGNFEGLTLTQADQNQLVGQLRNSWTPSVVSVLPNASASISFGGNDPILFGHRVGYLLSGTYSSGTDLRDNQIRALAARGTTFGQAVEQDRFEGQTASQNVLWGGLLNASTQVGNSSTLTVNGMYNRTADNDARIERGTFENEGLPVQITRMQYVERSVRSMQLAGEHEMGSSRFSWAVTSSGVRRDEPDRSEFIQVIEHDTPGGPEVLRWMTNNGAIRTFSELDERSNEGRASYQMNFGGDAARHSIHVGGLFRRTDRDADSREYSIFSTHAPVDMRSLSAEQLFDGRFTEPGDSLFNIAPLAQGGSYTAGDRLAAGYAMAEMALSDRIRVIAGARYEHDEVEVNAKSTLGSPVTISKNWGDLLPSITINLQLSESQQLRFAASRTLARPEYRELTPIATREVLNGETVIGNDKLERARIFNTDLRWESYPAPGEVISIALFAKQFDKPIERVYRAETQGHSVFFTNAEAAHNYGVEVEYRRELGSLFEALAPFSVFSNVTVMHSSISLSPDAEASATNLKRRMVGQAPYVVNAGLTYTSITGATTATFLYNVVGARIHAAGEAPLPDVVQESRTGMDLSLRFPLVGAWSARVDAKNLLNSPFRTTQGEVVREEYRIGRVLQAGIIWKP